MPRIKKQVSNPVYFNLEPKLKIVIDAMIQNECSEDEMVFVMYQSIPAWNFGLDKPSTDPSEIYAQYMNHRRNIQAYLAYPKGY